MSDTKPQTEAFILADFYDIGTGAILIAGTTASIEDGAFANYKAAGLVRELGDEAQIEPGAEA